MEFKRRRHNHAHMNIAPLVDVVFLLLLFFMLTSQLVREPAIKVNLPDSRTAETHHEQIMTISITRNGEVYFMDKRVDIGNLQKAIAESIHDTHRDVLRIKADREADVGILVNVIDEVKLSGITNFRIVTERKQ
jgi:biopolymer transport protein ExbD